MKLSRAELIVIRQSKAEILASEASELISDLTCTDDQQLCNVRRAIELMRIVKQSQPTAETKKILKKFEDVETICEFLAIHLEQATSSHEVGATHGFLALMMLLRRLSLPLRDTGSQTKRYNRVLSMRAALSRQSSQPRAPGELSADLRIIAGLARAYHTPRPVWWNPTVDAFLDGRLREHLREVQVQQRTVQTVNFREQT